MRSPLILPAFLALLGSLPAAQEVRDLVSVHRDGQTFLTWHESALAGTSYRVYRASLRIQSTADLDRADFLGEVGAHSSRNDARSEIAGSDKHWVIAPGGSELASSTGLFVHTVAETSTRSFYCVTSVRGGSEDRSVKSGTNSSSSSILELAAPPQPVLQIADATGELWAHWVGNRATPYLPALHLLPSQGFNFRFEPGSGPAPRGLVVALHAAGQIYGQGWPHRFELPGSVDLLALHDCHPYTAFSFWFGAHLALPGQPAPDTLIRNYTQQRVLWTIDWIQARLGAAHDRERLYAIGGSMGAIGSMLLAGEAPARFAAILCRNGLYDLEAGDFRNPGLFERLYGTFDLALRTEAGMPILDRFRASHMASRDLAQDWPVIRTISGRNDETVGWRSSVWLMQALAAARRPAVHYFDERTHTPQGYWAALERVLLARTCQVRRDRPALRFLGCTLDDDMGDGSRTVGDAVGTINGYVDYDPATARADAGGVDFDVSLRSAGVLDDAPRATGWAALAPRRTGAFQLAPGEWVRFELKEGAQVVDEHLLRADAHGLVRTPRVPLERTERHARFERWSLPDQPRLFLGRGPILGDELQAVVNGTPGTTFRLALGIGTSTGALFQQRGIDHVLLTGAFGPSGVVELRFPMPRALPAGTWIWGAYATGGRLRPLVGVAVQSWP